MIPEDNGEKYRGSFFLLARAISTETLSSKEGVAMTPGSDVLHLCCMIPCGTKFFWFRSRESIR